MPVATVAYPEFEAQVRDLVAQHRKSTQGGLHLAVYFAPVRRGRQDIFLFEIIQDFGGSTVSQGQKLFEFSYGSTPGLPLPDGVNLRMVMTNPAEFELAVREDWKGVGELREARRAGRAIVIHSSSSGRKLWELLG